MQLACFTRAVVVLGALLAGGTIAAPVLAQPSIEGLFKMAIEAAKERKAPVAVETTDRKPDASSSGFSSDSGFSQAGGGPITLLYDTDLPYNDYRSGMQDPALKGIDLAGCQQLCEADGRCNAFTFNSKARVCFLKSAAAEPERFKGAISGVKGQVGQIGTIEADAGSRALTRAEIADLQRALAARGYDVGKPDGKIGKKTKAAIAAFVAAYPGEASTRVDLALLVAVASAPGGQTTPGGSGFAELSALASGDPLDAATGELPGTPPPDTVFDTVEIQYAAGHPALFRMIVAARPALLEDRDLLTSLYESEGRKFTSSYRVDDELDAYKLEYLGRPVPRQVYLELETSAWLQRSQYSREQQLFPFDRGWDATTDRFIKFRAGGRTTSYDVEFSVPTMPEVRGIPMTLEEAEAFERDRMRDRDGLFSVRILRKVAMSGISFNEVRGAFEGNLVLFGVEAVEAYGDNKDAVLYAWAPTEAKPTAPPIALEPVATLAGLAETLPGLSLVDGRLNLRQSPGWPAFAASLFLTSQPDALGETRLLAAMGRNLLTEGEQETLWRGEPPYNWQHIYDLRSSDLERTGSVLAQDYAATISSRAIKPEVGIIDVLEAKFGAFDPAKGQIALALAEAEPTVRDNDAGAVLTWSYPGTVLPSSLPVDQDMARQLIEQLGGDPTGQTAYIAVFADVAGAKADPNPDGSPIYGMTLETRTTRIALFRDAALTEMIFDYYADPDSALLAEQKRQNEVLAVENMPSPSVDALQQLAGKLSGDANYLTELVNATLKERELNEFERTSVTQNMLDGLAGIAVPQPLWIQGGFRLGEYDIARQVFAIDTSTINMRYEGSRLGLTADKVQFAFATVPTEIAVPLEQARAFVERAEDSRGVDVRFRLTPLQVVVDRTRYGEIIPTITYHVDQMVVLAPNSAAPFGTELLADIDYGPFTGVATNAEADQVAAAPMAERPLFTQELAAALAYGDGSTPLAEADYRRLLGSRWLIEQDVGFASAMPADFFQDGAQLPAAATLDLYRADFANWLQRAGQAAPKHLQLRIDLRDDRQAPRPPAFCSDMEWGLRYVFQNQELAVQLFGDAGGSMQDLQMRQIGNGSDADPAIVAPILLGFPYSSAAGCEIAQSKAVSSALGIESTTGQSAFVVLDRMPMPNFLNGTAYTEAVVDVAVTDIVRRPSASGLPVLIVFATFEGADFNTVAVSDGQRQVTASVPFTAKSIAPASLSLDVLGITIGMPEAEADAKVRAYLKDALVISSVVDLSPAMTSFSDVKAYFNPALKERIALFFEAGSAERTVLAVHRVIAAPDWSLPRADVSGGAIAKYGPPAFEEYGEYATELAWGPGGTNRECRGAAGSYDFPDTWRNEAGETGGLASFVDWSTIRDNGLSILPQPNWTPELQRCEGVMLLKHTERYVETFLVDPALYYSAWQASMAKAKDIIAEKSKGNGASTIAF